MRRFLLLSPLVGALATGCAPSFDPITLIDKLRVIDIVADRPDLAGGESTTLTATAVNPGGPEPTLRWAACLTPPPPGTGQSINRACYSDDQGAHLEPLGEGPSVSATMPVLTSPLDLGLPDETNGVYLPIRVVLTAGDQKLTAFYKLRYFIGNNPRNNNPMVVGLWRVPDENSPPEVEMPVDEGAAPIELQRGEDLHLRARAAAEEPYQVYDGNPLTTTPRAVNEILRIGWYATAGKLDHDITGNPKPDNKLTMKDHLPDPGAPIDLWIVVTDERGGSSFTHRTFLFR
jgi:hypothetical protein